MARKKVNWWSAEDMRTLKRLYPKTTNADIAHQLGRSATSVQAKAYSLGLRKPARFRKTIRKTRKV